MQDFMKGISSRYEAGDNEIPNRTITEVFHFRFILLQIRTLRFLNTV